MKFAAKFISVVFHPLLFPAYGLMLLLSTNPTRFGHFGEKLHVLWFIIVFMLTFVFPVIWLTMMKRLEMIDTFSLETTKERIVPLIATATFYLWTTWMFKSNVHLKIPTDKLIFYMMLGACIGIFITLFTNIFMKISLHTLGAGNLLGLLLPLVRLSTYDLRPVFLAAILLAGIIGAARLVLKAHTPREVYIGYLVGFMGQFIAFTFAPKFV
jgi:membrane-associated phospholipid phosphatase